MTKQSAEAIVAAGGAPLLEISVGDQLRRQASAHAERPALTWARDGDPGLIVTLTYHRLLLAAEATAARILQMASHGDRVAVWTANSPQAVIVEYASALAGTVLAPFNPAWTDEETEHALSLVAPRILFVASDVRGTDLRGRARNLADAHACAVIDMADVPTEPSGPAEFDAPEVAAADAFLIQFTSGTTGRAKGATLSHRAALNAGHIRACTVGADASDVWLNPIPLCHVGGSVVILLAAMATGGNYVVMPRFDPVGQYAMMRATGATRTGGVPTMFHALLNTPGGEELLGRVRSIGLGGTNVPPSLVARLQELGATVSAAFAQSECPMITQSDPAGDAAHVCTTAGVVVPHTELRILDRYGTVLGSGEVGEVCVRSPLVMDGYWQMPEATAEVIDAEGLLHTGDLGSLDAAGVLRIHGRVREVIIRGGENVYPSEVENVLHKHPGVDAVAVLGVPDQRWGQEVAAVVKTATTPPPSVTDLIEHARRSVSHFKVPRHWRFVDDMPLTSSGKIRKNDLSALFAGHDS
ncbi:class I adenylate-forming enzyme family protein [Mycobacterium sp. CPCC 205372]|uniref:Class I adenylate-forming enzyme family protein n=1 Tax=Mycobacterium hippophais TaxID=3016340 RepID=A0ABT4PLA5_9MYCO|nr:class I adenylate-forming enzyme family protein [Mycobacterium hippophais]MCZ8377342.1 class I adenylate-forming enzyme family protein [Mycobacterium hippophais]